MSSRSATRSFDGLNLTFECREGILKHCSYNNARELGELGERFIKRQQPGLEAQLANSRTRSPTTITTWTTAFARLWWISSLREVRLFSGSTTPWSRSTPSSGSAGWCTRSSAG
jgi:hypothetical protein